MTSLRKTQLAIEKRHASFVMGARDESTTDENAHDFPTGEAEHLIAKIVACCQCTLADNRVCI